MALAATAITGLAAVWPVGLVLAVAVGGGRLASARRRAALNRALHELRRPLQILALDGAAPARTAAEGALDLALAAVDDLDREINGSPPRRERRPVLGRALVEQAVERWRRAATLAGRSLEVDWQAGEARLLADPARVAQALDNLIANAIEHGGLLVRIEVTRTPRNVRIVVADRGRLVAPRPRRDHPDPRRGHGLRLVARVAAEHGGRFVLGGHRAGTVAALELPIA